MVRSKFVVVFAIVLSILVMFSAVALAAETKETEEKKTETKKTAEKAGTKKSAEEAKKIIEVNSATQEELETLPGIGPELAKRIMAARPFEKVEDLMEVKGIAEKKLEKIKDLIEVKPAKKAGEKEVAAKKKPSSKEKE